MAFMARSGGGLHTCYNADGKLKGLGEVEAERFIYLMKREDFDYTEWQRDLWKDRSIDEVYKLAVDREKARNAGRN